MNLKILLIRILLPWDQTKKRNFCRKEIENAENDFSDENKNKLIIAINNALNIRSASETAFIFFLLLLIGLIYLYWPIF